MGAIYVLYGRRKIVRDSGDSDIVILTDRLVRSKYRANYSDWTGDEKRSVQGGCLL